MGSTNLHQCVHHQVQVQRKRKSSMKKLNFNVDHGDHKGDRDQEGRDQQKDQKDHHVQFTTIEIRTHSLCIGDNPGGGTFGAMGAPISLDWKYDTEHESYNLDEYEEKLHNDHNNNMTNSSSSKRRNIHHQSNGNKLKQWQLILQPFEREFILIHKLGYTKEEINVQRKMIKIDRNQRKHTRRIMIFEPIEIGLEHFRKWKKNRNRNNNNNGKTTKDESQQPTPFMEDSCNTSTSSSESISFSCSCQENK